MSGTSRSRFVTLQELCEMLGISKSRFYQLQKRGIFPAPQRTSSNRPVFDQTLSQQCVEIVRSRVGLNGEPVLFNRKPVQEPSKKRPVTGKAKHEDLIASLASLGVNATAAQVEEALKGIPAEASEPERIKALFLVLRKSA